MKFIIYIKNWLAHFFWLLGWMIWCLVQFDIANMLETYWWLRIHLTHKCTMGTSTKISAEQKTENHLIIILGLSFTLLLLLIIIKLII